MILAEKKFPGAHEAGQDSVNAQRDAGDLKHVVKSLQLPPQLSQSATAMARTKTSKIHKYLFIPDLLLFSMDYTFLAVKGSC
jgi:hypothetical protein